MFGLFSKEFLGWHDDKTLSFLIGDEIKNVILEDSVNISNNSRVITYTNPYKNLIPLAVNHQKDTFLFTDVSENRKEDKIIITNLNRGRGCGPFRIKSQNKGEIIFDAGGCLNLDKKYFSNDGYLHLKLTNLLD